MHKIFLIGFIVLFFSCVSVPKEAPQLSQELTVQLEELEQAHLALVHKFFDGQRKEVRTFITEEWTPLFAENFFKQPAIAQSWNDIVSSDDKEARLEFISMVAPEMQFQTEKAYQEIVAPLNELESVLIQAIREKYEHSLQINHTLTNFLLTASKTAEIRNTYLQKTGIDASKINNIIDQIDLWTDQALQGGEQIEDVEVTLNRLKDQLDSLLLNFKS